MAGTRYLEIIAELRDKVTQKVEQMERGFNRFEKQLERNGNQWKRFGRDLQQFGQALTLAGAAISGPFLLALHNSAQYSIRVSDQINRMKNASDQFQLTLANALVPILEKFNNAIGYLLGRWNALDSAMRDNIIQATFMAGVYLTVSGLFVAIIGKVITFAGEVMKLTAAFIGFAAANLAILLVAAAVALLIIYWERLRSVAVPILNAIEISANMVAIGFHKIITGMVDGVIRLSLAWADYARGLASIPGMPLEQLLKAGEALDNVAAKLRIVSVSQHDTLAILEQNITNIAIRSRGSLVGMADSVSGFMNKFKEMVAALSNPPKMNIEPVVQQFNAMESIAQGTAQAMTSSLSEGFFNIVTGKIGALKETFANFGKMVIQILTQALAKFILVKTIGAAFPGLGKFFHQGGMVMHAGGMIQRAHNGMLANDEVPIIAQTGEAVLSRKGVSALGVENVYKLNRGQSPGGGNTYVTFTNTQVIQAWDATDVMRNKKAISAALAEDLSRNAAIRQILRVNG